MKKFCSGAVLAMLFLTLAWLWGVRSQLGVPTPETRWIADAYRHKFAAANGVSGPRVLVVAGSNAMFGIDTAQLEAYWHRPAVNLAVNAGLGLPFILDTARRIGRAGDVILMPMEYALYLDDGKPSAQVIDYAIGRDLDYWRSLSRFDQLHLAAAMAPERWVRGLRRLPDPPVTAGTYGAHHLDARGDQTNSAAADQTPADAAAVRAAKVWHYGARAATEAGGWKMMAAFGRWAHAQGVCVVAVPTVLLHQSQYDSYPQERIFYSGLAARLRGLGIPYAGRPRDFMYPATWFFDTDHHLQDWARKKHTAELIRQLTPDPHAYCQ